MSRWRLDLVDPEISRLLLAASEEKRASFVLSVVKEALDRVAITDPAPWRAIAELESSRESDPEVSSEVSRLLDEAEHVAWSLAEHRDEDGAANDAYLRAFAKARALNALEYLMQGTSADVAAEATYEAVNSSLSYDRIIATARKVL